MTAQTEIWPTIADVEELIADLSAEQGATLRVANRGLLESALGLPHQGFYETFWDKLAALVRSIAANHALSDGNKRLALTVLYSALCANRYCWLWSEDDGQSLILRIARGEDDFRWLSAFLEHWTVGVPDWGEDASLDTIIAAIEKARRYWIQGRPQVEEFYRRISAEARGDPDPSQAGGIL